MTGKGVIRAGFLICLLFAAVATSVAGDVLPVTATAFRFTSTSTQSYVDVILSNQNPFPATGKLTVQVVQSSGISRAVVVSPINIPPGNSFRRVLVPGAIDGVRWARLTNLLF